MFTQMKRWHDIRRWYVGKTKCTFEDSYLLRNCYLLRNRYKCLDRMKKNYRLYGEIGEGGTRWKDLRFLIDKRNLCIPFMDLCVNSVCTLHCAKCTQGMPYLKNRTIDTAEEIIQNMEELLSRIDYIFQMGIIGGEPFLNRDLDKVISWCVNHEKIGWIVVVTNGTIFPDEKILNSLKNKKVWLGISYYELEDDSNRKKLLDWVKREGVRYTYTEDQEWYDFLGDKLELKNYSKHILRESFESCVIHDCVAFKGKVLYRCPKAALLYDLGVLGEYNDDMICLDRIKGRNDMKHALKRFYCRDYLVSCQYCFAGDERKKCKPGVQVTHEDIVGMQINSLD